MEQDQVKTQDQVNADESKNVETNQEQGNSKAQETITNDSIEKVKADIEAKFKAEIAGLNRKAAELDKQLKEKERESLTEAERKAAELKDLDDQRTAAETELNNLRKARIIDGALYDNELPADLFSSRVTGETEEEIKADVAKLKGYIQEHVDKEVERRTKELLKGKDPGRQDGNLTQRDQLIAQYNEAEKKGDAAMMLALKGKISKLPK